MQQAGGVQIVQFKDQSKLDALGPSFFAQWYENMNSKGLGEPANKIIEYWTKRRAELK